MSRPLDGDTGTGFVRLIECVERLRNLDPVPIDQTRVVENVQNAGLVHVDVGPYNPVVI